MSLTTGLSNAQATPAQPTYRTRVSASAIEDAAHVLVRYARESSMSRPVARDTLAGTDSAWQLTHVLGHAQNHLDLRPIDNQAFDDIRARLYASRGPDTGEQLRSRLVAAVKREQHHGPPERVRGGDLVRKTRQAAERSRRRQRDRAGVTFAEMHRPDIQAGR